MNTTGHLALLTFLLILWFILTVGLALSLIGILVFVMHDDDEKSWFAFGHKLINKILQ